MWLYQENETSSSNSSCKPKQTKKLFPTDGESKVSEAKPIFIGSYQVYFMYVTCDKIWYFLPLCSIPLMMMIISPKDVTFDKSPWHCYIRPVFEKEWSTQRKGLLLRMLVDRNKWINYYLNVWKSWCRISKIHKSKLFIV